MSEKIRSSILIKVVTSNISDMCVGQYFFKYEITIINASKDTVMLVARHWDIMDMTGEPRTVNGLGVVGEQPVIRPGEQFSYHSGVAIDTSIGTMGGYYVFRNFTTSEEFEVEVPTFTLMADFLLN